MWAGDPLLTSHPLGTPVWVAALVLDPSEVREEPMDEQVAAPMDDVDPYTDTRQFKPAI